MVSMSTHDVRNCMRNTEIQKDRALYGRLRSLTFHLLPQLLRTKSGGAKGGAHNRNWHRVCSRIHWHLRFGGQLNGRNDT